MSVIGPIPGSSEEGKTTALIDSSVFLKSLVSSSCSETCLFKKCVGSEGGGNILPTEARLSRVEGEIEESILNLTEARGPAKSICPSEVCRKIFPVTCWRHHMPLVRKVGFSLAEEGVILVTQRNQVVPSKSFSDIKGPIRFKQASSKKV